MSRSIRSALHRVEAPNAVGIAQEIDEEYLVRAVDLAADHIFANVLRTAHELRRGEARHDLRQIRQQCVEDGAVFRLRLRVEVLQSLHGVAASQSQDRGVPYLLQLPIYVLYENTDALRNDGAVVERDVEARFVHARLFVGE